MQCVPPSRKTYPCQLEKEPASSSLANLTKLLETEVRFEVLVTALIKTAIFVDVAPCKLVDDGGTYCSILP
jgi:hypothetical protein